nr:PREDICTED: luciferin 4-monooxygenase-like isoform X2 [Linepithema humile]
MASKSKIKDIEALHYEITNFNGMKISMKKKSKPKPNTETDASSLKIKNSEEDKENLHKVASHDETNKTILLKTSKKKRRRNKKNTSNEASESKISSKEMCHDEKTTSDKASESKISSNKRHYDKKTECEASEPSEVESEPSEEASEEKIEDSKVSVHQIRKCDGKDILVKALSRADIAKIIQNKKLDNEVKVCNVVSKADTDKSEVPVEENEIEEMIFNEINEFTVKNNILIGKQDSIDKDLHIGNLILLALKAEPQFIGQIDVLTGERTTFQEMREKSVKCASWLQIMLEGEDQMDKIITICTRNPMQAYIPYLASLYLGLMVNPWDENYFESKVRILYFLNQNMPRVIFVDDENAVEIRNAVRILEEYDPRIESTIVTFGEVAGFLSLKRILEIDVDKTKIDEFKCNAMYRHIDTAIVMFSSNAVSYPGEVQIPYMAFVSPSNLEVPFMTYGETGLWYGSLCWTHSLLLTVRAILSFNTALKIQKMWFDEETFYSIITKYKPTWVFLESSLCEKMLVTDIMVKRYDVSCLKQFLFGDTPIDEGIHEDFIDFLPSHIAVTQVYADTGAGVIAYQRDSGALKCSGYISKNVSVAIIDLDTKKVVGKNVCGEIWCKTPYNYTPFKQKNYPEMDSKFDDWYCTGDFGYYDDNGEIYVLDKVKHLIKYKDSIVIPSDIEEMLLNNWDIAEVVVIPTANGNDGQHPMALVRRLIGVKITEEQLIKCVEEKMDDKCKLRGGVYFMQHRFKRLPNGKVDRSRVTYNQDWRQLDIAIDKIMGIIIAFDQMKNYTAIQQIEEENRREIS